MSHGRRAVAPPQAHGCNALKHDPRIEAPSETEPSTRSPRRSQITAFLPALFALATITIGIACWEVRPRLSALLNAWLPGDPQVQIRGNQVQEANGDHPSAAIHGTGELRPIHESELTAPVAGVLEAVRFRVGDAVSAGEIIAAIRPSELLERLRRTEAELAAARAQAEQKEKQVQQSEAALQRTRDLWSRDLIARQELSGAEAALAAARADAELARAVTAQQQATIDQLRYQLRFDRITAPFDGTITERLIPIGSRVRQGQTILLYARLDPLRFSVSIPASIVAAVSRDAPVEVTVAGFPKRVFTGSIRNIAPPRAGAVDAEAEIEVTNEGRVLRPGMQGAVVLRGKAELTGYFFAPEKIRDV